MNSSERWGARERHADLVDRLLKQLTHTARFGFEGGDLDDPILLTSFPYYFRSRALAANLEPSLRELVASTDASNVDRLWAFSFLEDDDLGLSALATTPPAYSAFLHECGRRPPLFIQKMARFQLVVISNDAAVGMRYVNWVRHLEADAEEDIAAHLRQDDESASSFLLRRLHDDRLAAALPITIYRLGLFGDAVALAELRDIHQNLGHEDVIALVNESIHRIGERLAATPPE